MITLPTKDLSMGCLLKTYVSLQVSSIRENQSDDKRFSIFTGMKRLHLRAKTHEDRRTWLEALHAVKEMFPRMPNSELMAPAEGFVVSTDKLKHRLIQEGLNDSSIQDIEQIIKDEFSGVLKQLVALKQKHALLINTLQQLEVLNMFGNWDDIDFFLFQPILFIFLSFSDMTR